jgi:hypothetical protein
MRSEFCDFCDIMKGEYNKKEINVILAAPFTSTENFNHLIS